MKKVVLNYLVIAALAISAAFTSCGGGSSRGSGGGKSSGKIKMTTETGGGFSFRLAGSGVATVDWGDGSEKVSLTLNEYGVEFSHTYPNASMRTITISGDNIMGLFCYQITSLDVSRCTELTMLSFSHTPLTKLDVSKNTALTKLYCSYNPLTSLDVSKNTALTELNCSDNQLTSLDVSKNTMLTLLICSSNQLTSLDVSKNTSLLALDCNFNNQLIATGLDALFATLHSNAIEGSGFIQGKTIYISGKIGINSGDGGWVSNDRRPFPTCDRSIAERKGWTVQ